MRVIVAMSGGVDSSVAALLLKEAGHDVLGVFLRNGVAAPASETASPKGCCSVFDACDAEEVAGMLGIAFYSLDHSRGFESIIDRFVDAYARGETPNPCVQCNRDLKFGELFRFAKAMGAEAVATGHYAQVEQDGESVALRRGRDRAKDQSYVLATVRAEALRRSLFPVGGLPKEQVRELARRAGLPVYAKHESQEICFVPSGDYRDLMKRKRPDLFREGVIETKEGEVLGRHSGAAGFTVGQRRGLGLGGAGPYFVVETDPTANRVVVGRREDLPQQRALLREVNWLVEPLEPGQEIVGEVQIRAHHSGHGARARVVHDGQLELDFDPPGETVSPGQIGVVYHRDRVVAAGRIARLEVFSDSLKNPV